MDVYRSFIYNADTWQQLRCSSVEWIIVVYSDDAYYSELKINVPSYHEKTEGFYKQVTNFQKAI